MKVIKKWDLFSWLCLGWVEFFPLYDLCDFLMSPPQCCPSIFPVKTLHNVILTKIFHKGGGALGEVRVEFPSIVNFEDWLSSAFCFLQNKKWTGGFYSQSPAFLCFLQCAPLKCVLLCLRPGVRTLEHVFRSFTFIFLCVGIWTGFQYCTKIWFLLFAFITLMH